MRDSYNYRAIDLQPALYLAIGALVQSLAFTQLMSMLLARGTDQAFSFKDPLDQVFWIRFITAFEVILLVWHEYAYGIIYFKWEWDFWDSCVPFLMGAAEYYLILNVFRSDDYGTAMSQWYWAMFWVALIGGLSYLNQLFKAQRDPESRHAYSVIKQARVAGLVTLGGLLGWFAYSGLTTEGARHTAEEKIPLLLLVLGITTVMLAMGAYTHRMLRRALR